MKMKTEMGVMFLQAKERKIATATIHWARGLEYTFLEGTSAAGTLILDFQPSESVSQCISVA